MLSLSVAIFVLVFIRVCAFVYQKRLLPEHYGDDLGHLIIVKEFERTSGKRQDLSWMYPLTKSDYPTGFHYLIYLMRIPIRFLEQFGGLVPAVVDSALIILFAFVIDSQLGTQSYWLAMVPFCRLFYEHDGRSIHFSERAFGMLAGSAYLVSIFMLTEQDGSIWYYGIGLLGFIGAVLSSKFASQALFFFSLLMTILLWDLTYLVGLIVSFSIANVISRGLAKEFIEGLIRHSAFYKRVFMHINPAIKNHYRDLLGYLIQPRRMADALSNSVIKIVANNPFNLAVVYCTFVLSINEWVLFAWCGIALTLIVSLKPLTFLGEPERYLEYSLLPSVVVLLENADALPLWVFVAMGLITVLVFYSHYKNFTIRCNAQSKAQIYMPTIREWFADIHDSTILTIPMRYGLYAAYDMTPQDNNRILGLHANVGDGEAMRQYEYLLGDVYPYTNRDVDGLIENFDIDYILVDKAAVAYLHKQVGEYYARFNKYEIVNESPIFMLVKTNSQAPNKRT